MKLRTLVILSGAAMATGAFTAQALAEGPQERKARELCTEAVDADAYNRWSVKDGATCKKPDVTACTIVSKDGVEANYTCPVSEGTSTGSKKPKQQIQE
ncbi:hypothetical protein [Hyphococcus sp.]|uniref:hypothetical protein n=1 Tax=Hyphococcus sp. TaxID=2038636 RepID=UPI002083FFC7|nr:MAG: hypothetical protein DHS20C04_12410 [Marinicaulis sp.]